MKIKQLKDEARKLVERLTDIRGMEAERVTDEIRTEMKSAMDRLDELKVEIADEERAQSLMADFEETTESFRTDPQDNAGEERSDMRVGDKREEKKPWASSGEFFRCVANAANGRMDERLSASLREERAASGMSEGVLSDGGFLIPPEFSGVMLHDAIETGMLSSKCRKQVMSRTNLTIPGVDETSRANGSRWGGIQTYWENEADELTSSKPKFRQINMKAKKLTGLIYMTDELMEDAPAIESFIGDGFKNEFGFKMDDSIIRGTGAGDPLGILNAGCLVSQAKETGQSSATITGKNVMKMFKRMLPRSLSNAVWYINQECWEQIFSLSMEIGTGGIPLFIEAGKLPNAPYGSILGRPIQPIEQCEALGTVGDILFADLGAYILATKGGIQQASSIHVKFLTAQTAFRFILRVDGEPLRASALTPYKGSDTLSSFVVLATRS